MSSLNKADLGPEDVWGSGSKTPQTLSPGFKIGFVILEARVLGNPTGNSERILASRSKERNPC
jgi:hypothetical protein